MRALILLLSLLALPTLAAGLNDTGIGFCGTDNSNTANCATVSADGGTHPRQDARYGRDAAAAAGRLTKIGGGEAGFDFTALNASGQPTTPSSGATPHPCVRDNVTGLVWEVKTADRGLRDWNWTYTWYDSVHNYGGSPGTANGGSCQTAGRCDSEKYVADLKAVALCGFNDWRMPTAQELESLLHRGRTMPAIDPTYFPNTPSSAFWTGSPQANSWSTAWGVNFDYSYVASAYRSNGYPLRLVSNSATNPPSTGASFAVTTAASTATTGTPLAVSVARTITTGFTPGSDTLTLTSTLAGTFTPPTLSFAATDGASSIKASSITFSASGTATLSATGATTVVASGPVLVSPVGTAACGSFTAYPQMNLSDRIVPETLSIGNYSFGGVTLKELRGGYAVGALAFKVPSATPGSGYWVFQYSEYTGGARAPIYTAISECSGDMRGAGKPNNANDPAEDILCRRDPASDNTGVVFSNLPTSRYCKLTPGKTYYYNIRARDVSALPGMIFGVSNQ
jgi:hypothetical protein